MTFCGNPENHPTHKFNQPITVNGLVEYREVQCDGVQREVVEETIVEKFDPKPELSDGTKYAKVTIIIEEEDTTTIVEIPRTALHNFHADYSNAIPLEHISLEYVPVDWQPEVRKITFETQPDPHYEGRPFIARKVKNNG